MRFYCLYCARQFLNAQSLIRWTTWNTSGVIVESETFNERGYEAIEHMACLMDDAKAEGFTFRIEMNQQVSTGMLYATMMIQGTTVCTSHAFDADPMNRTTGPQGYPISTAGIRRLNQ